MKEYSFTPVQLKEIPLKKYPKDFTFILNGQCYQTSRLVTDLLSPTIRCSSLLDDTIQQFEIKINDKDADIDNHSIEYFDNLIQSILTNSTLSINDHNRRFYIQLFFQLGNIDEYIKFASSVENEISLQTVFDRINAIKLFYSQTSSESSTDDSFSISTINHINKELEFIAQHFYEIDESQLENLEDNFLEYIISNENLQIKNEDSLLLFIMRITENRPCMSYLFEYVEFCNLSEKVLEQFIESFSIDNLNQRIWLQICKRLQKKVDPVTISSHKYISNNDQKPTSENILTFQPNESDFNGIMRYLTKQTGGNIHSNGTIKITANSKPYSIWYPPQNVVDFDNSDHYYDTTDYSVSSKTILFDFNNMKVQLSHYSIQSANNYFMKNWYLETSDDLIHWTTIHTKSNCGDLNGSQLTSTYSVQSHEFSRYVRYRHEGPCWSDSSKDLSIQTIEFYGNLQNFTPKGGMQ